MNKQVIAISKGVSLSPRKVGVVASLVRGRSVTDALTMLEHTPRRAALVVSKTIISAKANARNNHNLNEDSLQLAEITVSHGTRMKRYKPAAHGRALPFRKRSSHIKVVLDGVEVVKKKPVSKKERPMLPKGKDSKPASNKKEKT